MSAARQEVVSMLPEPDWSDPREAGEFLARSLFGSVPEPGFADVAFQCSIELECHMGEALPGRPLEVARFIHDWLLAALREWKRLHQVGAMRQVGRA